MSSEAKPQAPAGPDPDSAVNPVGCYPAEGSIVLVGLMGAGKTTVGRRLAQRLGLPFVDADTEIERAAGETIPEIFERHGEAVFRDGERRVITRLLEGPPQVLATGGGAFMDSETRAKIAMHGVSIWLKTDLDTLMKRVTRRSNRPLLKQGDPRAVMERLIGERYPVYAQADITIECCDGPLEAVVDNVIAGLESWNATSRTGAPAAKENEHE